MANKSTPAPAPCWEYYLALGGWDRTHQSFDFCGGEFLLISFAQILSLAPAPAGLGLLVSLRVVDVRALSYHSLPF